MAVDVCSEIASLVVSPRISFSHDLKETDDIIPNECHHFRSDAFLLESTIDFDFCLTNQIFTHEISSADELFFNGKILPVEVKKSTSNNNNNNIPIQEAVSAEGKMHVDLTAISTEALRLFPIDSRLKNNSLDKKSTSIKEIKQSEPQALPHKETKPAGSILENATNVDTKKKRLKEFLSNEETEEEEKQKLPQAKPFWQFRRSSSLNCENGRSNGLIRSSFQFLSRSNSTGSAPTTKQSSSALPKLFQKQNSQKEHIKVLRKSSSLSSSSSSSSSSSFNQNHLLHSSSKRAQSHSHPLKKSYSRSYGNGVKISPVLNLPPTYISKGTVCLFGLGSLFCNGKSKKKK